MRRIKPSPPKEFTGTVTATHIGERVTIFDQMGTNDGLRATVVHLSPCMVKIDGRGRGFIANAAYPRVASTNPNNPNKDM